MRYMLLAQLLFLSSAALHGDKPASCELGSKSIISRSSSGLAQVSNLADIQIRCHVPARPFPTKPGEGRYMLRVTTFVYEVSQDGSKQLVPSEVHQSGGGSDLGQERVDFLVHVPLDPAERDAEASRYLAKIEKSTRAQITEEVHQRALQGLLELVYQHRVGHFRVECRVSDGDRLIGVGVVELEVLFKGRFSDVGLPAQPTA